MEPRVRKTIFDEYWRFASERQTIFFRRMSGEDQPWTDDTILRRYKFCNAYRASDRVSQYLISRVIYGASEGLSSDDVFMRVVLFRLFSRESTWEALESAVGRLTLKTLSVDRLATLLDDLRRRTAIYTSAFILPAHSPYGYSVKHRTHLALVEEMFRRHGMGRALSAARSLSDVYEALLQWPTIGPFLAYQIAIDLNYTDRLDFCENDFTMPGPGAIRGLRKVFVDSGGLSPAELVMWMVERQETEFARLGLTFKDLFGRRLHAIDCQGLFCEIDKYSRESCPELKTNRHRIKHQFRPSQEPIEYFYPPKWGINEAVQRCSRSLGRDSAKTEQTQLFPRDSFLPNLGIRPETPYRPLTT